MNKFSVNNSASTELMLKLQELPENELSINILVPLFKSLNYMKVEFYGGPYEEGKDLICWKTDELGFTELGVVQVKKYKPSAKSSDSKSFSEIVNQLQQASEISVPFLDGQKYLPSAVYLITPYPLETRALQSRFAGYASLASKRVKIVDGDILVKLVKKHLPEVAEKLCGPDFTIHKTISSQLINKEILDALDLRTSVDVSSFYSDLEFCLGKVSTRFFFKMQPTTVKSNIVVPLMSWTNLVKIIIDTEKLLGIRIINNDNEQIDNISIIVKKNISRIKDIDIIEKEFDVKIKNIEIDVRNILDEVSNLSEIKNFDTLKLINEDNIDAIKAFFDGIDLVRTYTNNIHNDSGMYILVRYNDAIIKIENILKKSNNQEQISNCLRLAHEIRKLSEEKDILLKSVYQLELNSENLAKKIIDKQTWFNNKIEQFKKNEPQTPQLKDFLEETKDLFKSVENILSNTHISDLVLDSSQQKFSDIQDKSRITLPIQKIVDTGLNILVLGDAGAGKTTSLQTVAKTEISRNNHNKIIIYIPLASLISSINKNESDTTTTEGDIGLDTCIISYLKFCGLKTNHTDYYKILEENQILLLLDGIDEAINQAPWLISAIKDFSKQYPNSQIIASSRMSGGYIKKIPFLGITLLPFTPKQREYFITGWFQNKEKDKVLTLLNHLSSHPELSEITNTPLLTTIFCVLVQHNVPLPENEIRLYEERMRLLLGVYDIHKKISRIKSRRPVLELISRKVAFAFHENESRHLSFNEIVSHAKRVCKKLSKEEIVLAVEELIDPCNILMPMTEDGQFGFGHLRYQEYLSATEFQQNRSIDTVKYLHQTWWRGVLKLYSQLADSIEHEIEGAIIHDKFMEMVDTIYTMIGSRPIHEKNNLTSRVELRINLIKNDLSPDFVGF